MTRLIAIIVALVAAAVVATAASADVIVLSAKGGTLKSGDTIGDSDTIDLPSGASAQLLLPSGTIKAVSGPAKVSVATLTRGEKSDSGLFDKVAGLMGKSGNEGNVGAVRAIAPKRPPTVPQPFSLTDLPLDAEVGVWCFDKGGAVSLTRSQRDKPLTAALVDLGTSSRAEIAFQQDQAKVAWPKGIELKAGTYGISLPDRPLRQVRLVPIAKPPTEDTIRVLHGEHCDVQLRAFLREFRAAQN